MLVSSGKNEFFSVCCNRYRESPGMHGSMNDMSEDIFYGEYDQTEKSKSLDLNFVLPGPIAVACRSGMGMDPMIILCGQ